jgi:hypothetical protein
MIRTSQVGRWYRGLTRRTAMAMATATTGALVLAAVSGCGGEVQPPRYCTAVGCLSGLNIAFDGTFDPMATYVVDIAEVTATSENVPMARCTRTGEGVGVFRMNCTSTTHDVGQGGDGVRFPNDIGIHKVHVIVSAGEDPSVQVGDQTLEAVVSSLEINGPGCGVCTSARASLTIP